SKTRNQSRFREPPCLCPPSARGVRDRAPKCRYGGPGPSCSPAGRKGRSSLPSPARQSRKPALSRSAVRQPSLQVLHEEKSRFSTCSSTDRRPRNRATPRASLVLLISLQL